MFLLDSRVVTSASDLTSASGCEFAFVRALDAKLGRIDAVVQAPDAMYERTSQLGDEHERRVLEQYRQRWGNGVVEIPRPQSMSAQDIGTVAAQTQRAFTAAADVVFQATFFETSSASSIASVGFADFIVRQADGSYLVQDTKLARHARVTALLQLAAYAESLERSGVAVAPSVQLLLGDGSVSEHRLSDIVPVLHQRRARLHTIIYETLTAEGNAPVEWGDPHYAICGRCDTCSAEIEAHRDVLLVAGMRVTQRAKLRQEGIATIDELADTTGPVESIAAGTLAGLRSQARLQRGARSGEPPPVAVYNPSALAALPEADPGDIFFDFEGDPLYTEGTRDRWGLDYLFGLVDTQERFTAFWAHDFAQERVALRDFLTFLAERRKKHPGMHVFHYASYEKTHLLSLAARHGVGEDEVDQLLRENVLVDLYQLVRKAIRVGSRSYSIKKLEPLYMGDEIRDGEVTNAAASITEYATAMELYAIGQSPDAQSPDAQGPDAQSPDAQGPDGQGSDTRGSDVQSGVLQAADARREAQRMLDNIADYNRYDCVSTLRLRDWLSAVAGEHGVAIGVQRAEREPQEREPSGLEDELLSLAGDAHGTDRSADQTAAALAAAAIEYHRREQKSFWWGHFARLVDPIHEWEDTRDVLVIESAVVERDWHLEGKQRLPRRHLRVAGRLAPGSSIRPTERSGPFLLYEYPGPVRSAAADPGARYARGVKVLDVDDDGNILVEETRPSDSYVYDDTPSALTPAPPPAPGQQKPAIDEWARTLLDAQPEWPGDPATDILRRRPPRMRTSSLADRVSATRQEETIEAVTAAVVDLDRSYLAVQGPPGTGKTYLGARLIAALVRQHRWKIGVVAQSHAVVENLLNATVKAGLEPGVVGKVAKSGADGEKNSFTTLPADGHLVFALENTATGYVIGGTAWDFSNPARVPRASLDLLVVDEAGQFSLASTIAAAVSARNLVLLGDPQQLPQVSQGIHPEPIDESALGWVSAGNDVLPASFGFFLAESRRMHPAVAAPVSRLSYESKLHAHPDASQRVLAGVAPGLCATPIAHTGNATASPEEAAAVVEIVHDLLGREWTDPSARRYGEPLTQADLIVVTPYNAQANLVRDGLADAGYREIRVGTVDKFQGQEAVVAIVTLAASSPEDVPRGMSFLIMKNRLNVAISRAQWAAYLLYSPQLTEYLPATPDAVAELSAFIRLVETPAAQTLS